MRLIISLTLFLPLLLGAASSERQFTGWTDFHGFTRSTNSNGEVEWLSPKTKCRPADEFIPSWNADLAPDGWLRVELRAFHGSQPTKFYDLGHWSRNPESHPRESIKNQKDIDGNVDTDTLQLSAPADAIQFKLTLGATANAARLKLLGLSATDTRTPEKERASLRSVWGKSPLAVPQRSQLSYADGGAWCSPTTTSMLLAFWSDKLERPELNFDVPEVAHSIYDTTWKGTGNWAFNMAFAGGQPGMRAYVTRFNDVREIEEWIAAGYPVGLSIDHNRLRNRQSQGPSGHLVVCVGFERNGDVTINNPGSLHEMQKTFARERLIDAWAYSKNTVYLIYPEGAKLPTDKFGHWTIGRAK